MTRPDRKTTWSERLQPRNWSLPVKLIAVVAVPTMLALALGVLRVLDQSTTAASFDKVERIVALQERYTALTVELQEERDEVAQFVGLRDRKDAATLQVAFGITDAARDEATKALGAQPDLDTGTLGALRQVENNYFRLTQLRRQVAAGANDAGDLVQQYGTVIKPLLVFDDALARQLTDPQFNGLAQAIAALDAAREQVSFQKALVTAVIDRGSLLPEEGDALRSTDGQLQAATNAVRGVLTDEQQLRYPALTGPPSVAREQLKQSVLDRGRAGLAIDVPARVWNERSAEVLAQIQAATTAARDELRTINTAQQDAASNLAGINTVIVLLALLVGGVVVYLVARALIGSLRTLRRSALDIAERRLPEAVQSMRDGAIPDIEVTPVPVTTREEIGQMARAFDAVHSQAVRLAAEQATLQSGVSSMFANLSRRSQALVERQLQLIEQLESKEQDPDQLANLFQLDHLATRMRRNSENLLVLSGTDSSKRSGQPVPVVDVLRAAVSEVEQYQRLVVQSPPEARIVGRAASDLVHLLAELLDNATNFSAPDTQVVLSSQRTPDGSVLIEIVDRGVGMGAPELDDVNARLARPTAMDASASRRMGLFVVGRLASRHGLGVRLGGGTAAGTTATVTVPAYLIAPTDGGGPTTQRGSGQAGLPGREFVPPQRSSRGGARRPTALSSLVTGADAPAVDPGAGINGSYGGPAPNGVQPSGPPTDSTRNGVSRGSAGLNVGPRPDAPGDLPSGEPANLPNGDTGGGNGLPARRPGKFLGQAPPAAPSEQVSAPRSGPEATGSPQPVEQPSSEAGPTIRQPAPRQPGAEPAPRQPARADTPRLEDMQLHPSAPATRADLTSSPTWKPANSGLFAPAVPTEVPEPIPAGSADDGEQDLAGGATPIFEEIASAWFRDNRPIPVSYDDPAVLPSSGAPDGPNVATGQVPAARTGPPAQPIQEAARPATVTASATSSFASAADEGWRASAAAAESDGELTAAGLPKRRPRARLVPGSAASSAPVVPARTPETIRGRLSSYQDGVRQGRESRLRREAATAAGPLPESHDEEAR